MYVCMYVSMYVRIRMYVCMYVYVNHMRRFGYRSENWWRQNGLVQGSSRGCKVVYNLYFSESLIMTVNFKSSIYFDQTW